VSAPERDTEYVEVSGRRRLLPGVIRLRDVEDVEGHALLASRAAQLAFERSRPLGHVA
jgi:hypothetical protein